MSLVDTIREMYRVTEVTESTLVESHFKVGDEVICKDSGMEGKVVKVDPKEEGKYYTVEREDGKMVKYAPNELKLDDDDDDDDDDDEEKMDEMKKKNSMGEMKKKPMKEEVSLDDLVMEVILGEAKKAPKTDKEDDGEGLDPVDKKAVKKDFDDRKDKDLDNDGDTDDSDEYLHNKRKAVSKAIDKKKIGTSKKQEPVDVSPSLDEAKATYCGRCGTTHVPPSQGGKCPAMKEEAEMSDAEQKKREEIVLSMKDKEQYFKDKYGSRWKEVMYATATKMAQKKR